MLISYCTTCMGRLWQLKQTLPLHLKLFKGRADIEFILLDYNSADGLEQWIRDSELVQEAIRSGLLLYAKEHSAVGFHSSKAKNIAHRLASGNVLVNLDADNWAHDVDKHIREAFKRSRHIVFHAWSTRKDGSYGKIGIGRKSFYDLGGYDETFAPMGFQDGDLIQRARAVGFDILLFSDVQTPLKNTIADKTSLTGMKGMLPLMLRDNKASSAEKLAAGMIIRNHTGWGEATVSLNFGSRIKLSPLIPPTSASACRGLVEPSVSLPSAARVRHIRSLVPIVVPATETNSGELQVRRSNT